jgi:PKD repeat protein
LLLIHGTPVNAASKDIQDIYILRTKRIEIMEMQDHTLQPGTELTITAQTIPDWKFDHIDVYFYNVTGRAKNIPSNFKVNGGIVYSSENIPPKMSNIRFVGEEQDLVIKNKGINEKDFVVVGYAFYSKLKTVEANVSLDTALITFDIPGSVADDEIYEFLWTFKHYTPLHFIAPDGTDLMKMEMSYPDYYLSLDRLSFNPKKLGDKYGISYEGTWELNITSSISEWQIFDKTTPYAFGITTESRPSGKQLKSKETFIYTEFNPINSDPREWYLHGMEIETNVLSDKLQMDGAILLNEYYNKTSGTEHSFWLAKSRTLEFTNIGDEDYYLEYTLHKKVAKELISSLLDDQFRFRVDPPGIAITNPLETVVVAYALDFGEIEVWTPNEKQADSLSATSAENYYTIGHTDGPHLILLDFTNTYQILESRMFGMWPLENIPYPQFSYSPLNPAPNQKITFNSSGTITGYDGNQPMYWEFGDDKNSSLDNPVHEYAVAGTYNVTLKVSNDNGDAELTKLIVVSSTDISVDTVETGSEYYVGQQIPLKVTVSNNGDDPATIEIEILEGSQTVKSQSDVVLQPSESKTVTISLDSGTITVGEHTFTARAVPLPTEGVTENNEMDFNKLTVIESLEPIEISGFMHQPSTPSYDEEVTVTVSISGGSGGISSVELSYWDGSQWQTTAMTIAQSVYKGTIPPLPYGTEATYKVLATDMASNTEEALGSDYNIKDEDDPEVDDVSHSPEAPDADQDVTVTCTVTEPSGSSGIDEVSLFFRANGGNWQRITMTEENGNYSGVIDGQELGTTVEYYVEGADEAGNAAVSFTSIYLTPAPPKRGIPFGLATGPVGAVLLLSIIVATVMATRKPQPASIS